MTHDKQPTEDDVFRATLTLQEMPVLAILRHKEPSKMPEDPKDSEDTEGLEPTTRTPRKTFGLKPDTDTPLKEFGPKPGVEVFEPAAGKKINVGPITVFPTYPGFEAHRF